MGMRERVLEAEARCTLKLSDALAEVKDDDGEYGTPLRETTISEQCGDSGISYKVCGGGRQVIRRKQSQD